MICENPTLLFPFLKPSHVQMLTEALKDLRTQRIALYSFCYIVQLLQPSTELIRLLKRNDFFRKIADLLCSAPDTETRAACLYLARHCVGVSGGFRKCVVSFGIFHTILGLVVDDAHTTRARCCFLRHAAEYTFHSNSQVRLVTHLFEDFFSADTTTVKCGLKGFRSSISRDCTGVRLVLANTSVICRLTELLEQSPSLRIPVANLLVDFAQFPDFPIGEFLKYDTMATVFDCLLLEDAALVDVLLAFIKQLLIFPAGDAVFAILAQFGARNQLDIFAAASFDTKRRILAIYQAIAARSQFIKAFYAREWVSALCEYVMIGDVDLMKMVVDLLENIVAASPGDVGDEVKQLVAESEAAEQIRQFCNDTDGGFDDPTAEYMRTFLDALPEVESC
jgi:hypothetical protein